MQMVLCGENLLFGQRTGEFRHGGLPDDLACAPRPQAALHKCAKPLCKKGGVWYTEKS